MRSPSQRRWHRALVHHLIGVAIAVALVTGLVWWQIDRRATDQAEQAAVETVQRVAMMLALPLTSEDLTASSPWQKKLAEHVAPRLTSGDVVAVHLWARDDATHGTILWSTNDALRGTTRKLGEADTALRTGDPVIKRLGDGRESEGPPITNLYEIYQPFRDATGTSYVIEVYKPVRQYDEIRSGLIRDWLTVSILGVLIVGLLTLPLSLRLARSAATAERERALFAGQALRARAEEHRRFTEILHERTVQDLAAIRLTLESVPHLPDQEAVDRAMARSTDLLDADLSHLRDLLVGGEGTEWQAAELSLALNGWVLGLGAPIPIDLELPTAPLPLDEAAIVTALRAVKEAVRNALKHAEATRITVRIETTAHELRCVVSDDGRGRSDAAAPAPSSGTGLGIRLIQLAVADAGGTLTVHSQPSLGTRIEVTLPRSSPSI